MNRKRQTSLTRQVQAVRSRLHRLFSVVATAAVVAGGAGALTLASSVLAGADSAAAVPNDSSAYTLTCTATGTFAGLLTTPLVIPGVVTTGTLPTSVTAGSGFTLTNYGVSITLPGTGVFAAAVGQTISGTYTTSVAASGATPATQKTTLTIPTTTLPTTIPPTGVPLSASGPNVSLTAASTPGPITVTTGTAGTLAITVVGIGTVGLTCTNPATVIAKVTGAAAKTKVTSVLPNAAPLAGGTTTIISGAGFTGATAVKFGTTTATSFTVTSGTTITAAVPAHAKGTVDVTVTSPQGTSTITPDDQFTYTDGPIITGVSPSYGPRAGGTKVTITGLQLTLQSTTASTVAFGLTGAEHFTVTSPTQITATSPAHQGAVVDVTATNAKGTSIISSQDRFTYGLPGYWTVASDGGIFAYGDVGFYGSMGGQLLNKPVVGMAATPDGGGYWLVASDGGVFAFGDAQFYGSMGGKPLTKPIVGIAATPTGGGYWLVASDGGVFAFGDAPFYGSAGGVSIPAPIVSMMAASTGGGAASNGSASGGYWEIGSTGQVYAFGTPGSYGSMANRAINAPIVGASSTPDFNGNWLVGSDGGIYAFGNAAFYGSMGGQTLNKPVVGMASTPGGEGAGTSGTGSSSTASGGAASTGSASGGYYEVASDGGIFSFGSAHFYGSMGGQKLNEPMVGIAVT